MKLTTILREVSDRVRAAKSVAGLTGGTSGVDGLTVTNGGSGYANSFAVTFTGGGGNGAAGTATAIGGAIVSVEITNPGAGYTSAPMPVFTAGGGTGGAGTAALTAHRLDAIPTVSLPVGLVVFFVLADAVQFYVLAAGTDAESTPDVIRPDDFAAGTNEKVWKLASTLGSGGSSGGGSAAWGDITGTLANQTDLQDALDAKADAAALGDAAGKDVGTGSSDVAAGDRGLPSGGTARQTLRKRTGTDFDAEWVADPVVKFKAADETRSSTALADDGTLAFDVKNGVTYLIEGRLVFWEPSSSEKVKWTYSAPAAALANRNDFYSNNNEGSVRVKVEDGSFTATTDVTTAASLCSVFLSVVLTPNADGTFALQWANQDGGGATGPTLKKGSWMRVAVVV
jgi:hypothetical protein